MKKLSPYDAPILTRDGLTAVKYCFIAGKRVRPEEKLAEFFYLAETNTLTFNSGIHLWEPAEYWEYKYMSHGLRSYSQWTWEEFRQDRARRAGTVRFAGNFDEQSYCFQIETRDPVLVEKFRAILARCENAARRQEWHDRCEEEWSGWKKRWPNVPAGQEA